jgi:hypothetical protein
MLNNKQVYIHRPAGRKNLKYPSANIICPQRIIQPHPVSFVGPDGLPTNTLIVLNISRMLSIIEQIDHVY